LSIATESVHFMIALSFWVMLLYVELIIMSIASYYFRSMLVPLMLWFLDFVLTNKLLKAKQVHCIYVLELLISLRFLVWRIMENGEQQGCFYLFTSFYYIRKRMYSYRVVG
jgi:hypothetical protein